MQLGKHAHAGGAFAWNIAVGKNEYYPKYIQKNNNTKVYRETFVYFILVGIDPGVIINSC